MALTNDDPRPAYMQIADDLRLAIKAGQIAPGDQLPSTTELAERYDVARMTVRSALRVLRDDGLVVARQGKGVFVRSTVSPDGDTEAITMGTVMQRIEEITGQLDDLSDRLTKIEGSAQAGRRSRKN